MRLPAKDPDDAFDVSREYGHISDGLKRATSGKRETHSVIPQLNVILAGCTGGIISHKFNTNLPPSNVRRFSLGDVNELSDSS